MNSKVRNEYKSTQQILPEKGLQMHIVQGSGCRVYSFAAKAILMQGIVVKHFKGIDCDTHLSIRYLSNYDCLALGENSSIPSVPKF